MSNDVSIEFRLPKYDKDVTMGDPDVPGENNVLVSCHQTSFDYLPSSESTFDHCSELMGEKNFVLNQLHDQETNRHHEKNLYEKFHRQRQMKLVDHLQRQHHCKNNSEFYSINDFLDIVKRINFEHKYGSPVEIRIPSTPEKPLCSGCRKHIKSDITCNSNSCKMQRAFPQFTIKNNENNNDNTSSNNNTSRKETKIVKLPKIKFASRSIKEVRKNQKSSPNNRSLNVNKQTGGSSPVYTSIYGARQRQPLQLRIDGVGQDTGETRPIQYSGDLVLRLKHQQPSPAQTYPQYQSETNYGKNLQNKLSGKGTTNQRPSAAVKLPELGGIAIPNDDEMKLTSLNSFCGSSSHQQPSSHAENSTNAGSDVENNASNINNKNKNNYEAKQGTICQEDHLKNLQGFQLGLNNDISFLFKTTDYTNKDNNINNNSNNKNNKNCNRNDRNKNARKRTNSFDNIFSNTSNNENRSKTYVHNKNTDNTNNCFQNLFAMDIQGFDLLGSKTVSNTVTIGNNRSVIGSTKKTRKLSNDTKTTRPLLNRKKNNFRRKMTAIQSAISWMNLNEKEADLEFSGDAMVAGDFSNYSPPPLPSYSPRELPVKEKYQKKRKYRMSMTSMQHNKKSLRKPPKALNLEKRFAEFKMKQKKLRHNDEENNDAEIEEDKTKLDFISKYCIINLEQLHKFKSVFKEFSSDSPFEKPSYLPRKALWNTEGLTSEQKESLSAYEEVSYSLDAYQEYATKMEEKKLKISEELEELQRKLLSTNADASIELLKQKSALWTQAEHVEIQLDGYMNKYNQLKRAQKKLVNSLIQSEAIPKWLKEEIVKNEDTFKRTFLNNKHAYMESRLLKKALQKLDIQFQEKDLYFIEYIMQVSGNSYSTQLDLQTFCIVAAMAEKIANLDAHLRQYLNLLDVETMDGKFQKCKDLYKLISEVQDGGYRDKTIENLFAELQAGEIIGDDLKSVIAKLVNQGKVDFFDFVLYVPLFLKIHERILQRPIT